MEALWIGLILACVGIIFWVLQTVASEHRTKLNEQKPRIVEILTARIDSLERGETSSNVFQITTEELTNLSEYLSVFKKFKLNKEIQNYKEANKWSYVLGDYIPEDPQALLLSCKAIRKIIM